MWHNQSPARLRFWLTSGYALLIIYASLSPFGPWTEAGQSIFQVLTQPLSRTYTTFDTLANILAYIPLGFLATLTLSARLRLPYSLIGGVLLCLLLSAGMENLQRYLPRVSSNMDLVSNTSGALLGALLAASILHWPGLLIRINNWRHQIFKDGGQQDAGLALLALWFFGQTNPSLPMLGSVFITRAESSSITLPAIGASVNTWSVLAVTLNLLMLGTLLMTLLRNKRNILNTLFIVLCLVATCKFIIASLILKSSALLLWINHEAILGVCIGMLLLLFSLLMPRQYALPCSVIIAVAYLIILHTALGPNLPESASNILHWHYRHLLNYNGLAKIIMLIFPLLLLLHLFKLGWQQQSR